MNILSGFRTKEDAERVAAYINDAFVMFDDFPLTIADNRDKQLSEYGQPWLLEMTDHCAQYKKTVDQARTAIRDYQKGYFAGLAAR